MNKESRQTINSTCDKLRSALALIAEATAEIATAKSHELAVFDNLPGQFKEGATGTRALASAEALGDAVKILERLPLDLRGAIAFCKEAAE